MVIGALSATLPGGGSIHRAVLSCSRSAFLAERETRRLDPPQPNLPVCLKHLNYAGMIIPVCLSLPLQAPNAPFRLPRLALPFTSFHFLSRLLATQFASLRVQKTVTRLFLFF